MGAKKKPPKPIDKIEKVRYNRVVKDNKTKGEKMKTFSVAKEILAGTRCSGQIYSDGEYVELPDDIDTGEITLGYSVSVYEDNHIEDVIFYPVNTDTESFEDNSEEVLKKIKADFPAPEYQNNEW